MKCDFHLMLRMGPSPWCKTYVLLRLRKPFSFNTSCGQKRRIKLSHLCFMQHHAVSLDAKVTIMLMSQHLVITSNKVLATAGLVEHWVHGDNFDWLVEVDDLIVLSVVQTTDDHLEATGMPDYTIVWKTRLGPAAMFKQQWKEKCAAQLTLPSSEQLAR